MLLLFVLAASVLCLSKTVAGVTTAQGTFYRIANTQQDGQTVRLGALFPIHGSGADQPCGDLNPSYIQMVEAVVFSIMLINEDPSLLRNVRLAFDIRDTCLSVNYALQQSVDYIENVRPSGVCSDVNTALGASAIVGPFLSSLSEATANLFGLFEIPQISYGSTAPLLSDSRFGYFFRTIPSDLFQAKALADLVTHFNWSYIILLHSDDLYGRSGAEAFREELSECKNCIALEQTLSDSPPNYEEVVTNMNKMWVNNASVVLLFGHTANAVGMFKAISGRVSDDPSFPLQNLTWIGSDSWGDSLPEMYRPLAQGMLSTVPQLQSMPLFDEYFTRLSPLNNTDNPWFIEYWENEFNCTVNLGLSPPKLNDCNLSQQMISSRTTNYTQFSLVPLVINAIYALAESLHNLIRKFCPNGDLCSEILLESGVVKGTLLRDGLFNVSFESSTEFTTMFDGNGDVEGSYSILNLQNSFNNNQYTFTEVGTWDVRSSLLIMEDMIEWVGENEVPESFCTVPCSEGERTVFVVTQPSCFTCTPCVGIDIVDNETCSPCELGTLPNSNHTECDEIPIVFFSWSNPWAIALIVFSCIGINGTLLVIIIFVMYYKHELIKASSRELSAVLLVGILLCYVIPFFYVTKPSAVICGIRRFVVGFCFTISYSALLVKTNRIHRIFNRDANTSAKQIKFISPLSQVLLTGVFIAVQVVIAVVWLAVEPPDTTIDLSPMRRELRCGESPFTGISILLGYNLILLVVSTYFAFLTRKVPANFNEAKFINVTMYSICIIWLAFIPIYFGTSEFGTAFQTGTLVFGILLSATTALCCLFVTKIIILFSKIRKKKAATDSTHTTVGTTINLSLPAVL